MIMSGWILPDMYEVKCMSYSHSKEHLEIVQKYLEGLKRKNYTVYSEIMHEYYKLRTRRRIIDLEDFAVIKLGWIKVINSPIKLVFYSPESPMELLIRRYSKLGYTVIPIEEKISVYNVFIPSSELI